MNLFELLFFGTRVFHSRILGTSRVASLWLDCRCRTGAARANRDVHWRLSAIVQRNPSKLETTAKISARSPLRSRERRDRTESEDPASAWSAGSVGRQLTETSRPSSDCPLSRHGVQS